MTITALAEGQQAPRLDLPVEQHEIRATMEGSA